MKRKLIICGALAASTLLFTGCVYHSCGGGGTMPNRNWKKKHCAPQPNCEEVETMTIEAVAVPNNAPAAQNAPAPATPAPAAQQTPAAN